jgi:hypothetical protein
MGSEIDHLSHLAPSTSRCPDKRILLNVNSSHEECSDAQSCSSLTLVEAFQSTEASSNPKERWAYPRQERRRNSEDGIKVEKRRLANKRQLRRIIPLAKLRNRNKFQGHRMHQGDENDHQSEGCCVKVQSWTRSACQKSLEFARLVKSGVQKLLRKVLEKKREWDGWNPSKDHALAKCIDESKLAALKETVKPNRGILNR